MSDYGMKVPEGDPGAIRSAAGNLRRLANSLDRRSSAIRGEAGGIQAAWRDHNGGRAAGEARSLAHVASNRGSAIDDGASALKSFATELDDAQDKVRRLIARAREAATEAAQTAAHLKDMSGHPASAHAKSAMQTGLLAEKLGPLQREYDQVIEDLERKARSTGNKLSSAAPGSRKGMSPSDARRAAYTTAAIRMPSLAKREGKRLADEARKYLTAGERLPQTLLTQLKIGRRSAHFGTSFLEQLGTRDLHLMINVMESGKHDNQTLDYNKTVLGAIGDMLAHGTAKHSDAPLSDKYLDTLLASLDTGRQSGANAAWRISQLLAASDATFGRKFLDRVGDKFDALERDYPLDGGHHQMVLPINGTETDAFVGLFNALGNNARASQDFFTEGDRLPYYVKDRSWSPASDDGRTLGDALKAATTELPGSTSSALTKQLVDAIGSDSATNTDWFKDSRLSGLRQPVGDILTNYIHSANGALGDARGVEGYQNLNVDFDKGNLVNTMRALFTNDQVGNQLNGQLSHASQQDLKATLYDQLRTARSYGEADQDTDRILSMGGRALGEMFNANAYSKAAAGEDVDAFNGRVTKLLQTVENGALGGASGKIGTGAVGMAAEKGIPAAGKVGFSQLNEMLFPTDNEAAAIAAADDSIDPTTRELRDRFDPRRLDAHLDDLYGQSHEPGVERDDLLNWRHFSDAFEAPARANGISKEK